LLFLACTEADLEESCGCVLRDILETVWRLHVNQDEKARVR
jgi:hypothetical protein